MTNSDIGNQSGGKSFGGSALPIGSRLLSGVIFVVLAAASACSPPVEEPRSLDAFLNPEDAEAIAQQRQEDIQEAIRMCMGQEGFEYVPYARVLRTDPRTFRSLINVSLDDAFTQDEGYGVTTAVAGVNEFFAGDPNSGIMESLSPEQSTVYSTRLSICTGQAQSEVAGDYVESAIAVSELMQDLEARILADPRVIDGVSDWSRCMAESGSEFDSLEEPRLHVQAQASALFEATTDHHHDGDEDHQHERLLPSEDALQDLKVAEIALALIDARCREDTIPNFAQVVDELEAEFMETNFALLIRFRDANRP